MEETKKRLYFTADEKVYIKELAFRYRDIIENKKSDVVSVSMKKKKWQEITDEFNMNSQHTKRTAEQVRKCWENMKTKRKQELAQEKRQRMSTGGGPFPGSSSNDDPIMDAIDSVDIEIIDTIDSDTLALVAHKSNNESYVMLSDGSLGMNSEELKEHVEEEIENSAPIRDHDKATPKASRDERKSAVARESKKRLARCDLMLLQDKELHALKMKAAEMACQKIALEMEHMKGKHELEIIILKKKLSE
ncbi:myb/SANT-like DNA-binding domain-containing protein 3 [Anabrus simplex]|uniref:myb/SANT-like DNA-binding domain-containing protein 3 n=1 Tax=Anabrus simplex TaxID=316456 RepID=UPI0035A2E57C